MYLEKTMRQDYLFTKIFISSFLIFSFLIFSSCMSVKTQIKDINLLKPYKNSFFINIEIPDSAIELPNLESA